jgi:hypothetical protein
MNRKRLIALACAVGVMAIAIPTALAGGNGSVKESLLQNAFGNCDGSGIGGGALGNSFANVNLQNGTLSAEVHLQGAVAGGLWSVDVVSTASGTNCSNVAGPFLTTNSQGNGNVHVEIPAVAGDTGAFVLLRPLNAAAASTGFIASQNALIN